MKRLNYIINNKFLNANLLFIEIWERFGRDSCYIFNVINVLGDKKAYANVRGNVRGMSEGRECQRDG